MTGLKELLDAKIKLMQQLRTKPKPKLEFVPVIFANGEDDDTIGMNAALNNLKVQYKDKIYNPGESIDFDKCMFGFNKSINITMESGIIEYLHNLLNRAYAFYLTVSTRRVVFVGCSYNVIQSVRM